MMNSRRLQQLAVNAADPAYQYAVNHLETRAAEARLIRYQIGPGESGQWSHYYYCPLDGTKLSFEWSLPGDHQCPACGTVWRGQPYNGSWVTLAHARIGKLMRDAALYSHVCSDSASFIQVRETLLGYARCYTGYRIHGDIPYNGPGKLFAQTLDEAHWIIDLSYAYLFIGSRLEAAERKAIRQGLLAPCADFLIAHKEQQIHNHAVLITSAISILGFLLQDEKIMGCGLHGPFGLLDQLARGVLEDGMWYEGNFHYHYYAFDSLLKYAILVEGTTWDLREHPALKLMFDYPLGYLLPDGSFPNLNDASFNKTICDLAPYYEMAYAWYGAERYAEILRLAYGSGTPDSLPAIQATPVRRTSFEALMFGLPLDSHIQDNTLGQLLTSDRSSAASGLTKLVNGRGWHLMVKHSPFSGEHDHLDRLGLSFAAGHMPLFIDPGTTAYGVPAHYGWFKHTYAHNTVALNGADQPPADAELLQYSLEPWGSFAESRVRWDSPLTSYRMKPLITLPEEMCTWDEAAYRGACFRRINILTRDVLLDLVKVNVPEGRTIDLLYHISGTLEASGLQWQPWPGRLCALHPEWMEEVHRGAGCKEAEYHWRAGTGWLLHSCWCSEAAEPLLARTLNIPIHSRRQTLIQRVDNGAVREVVFVNAFSYQSSSHCELPFKDGIGLKVSIEPSGHLHIRTGTQDKTAAWKVSWSGGQPATVVYMNEPAAD